MFIRTWATALASIWLVGAQTIPDSSNYHTHAAFAFIRTGERTPILRNDTQKLTALGATQMYMLGENFRTRYIAGDSPNRLGVEHVEGLSVHVLDNDQIWVQTLDKPYLTSSAQALMQGLYPPSRTSEGIGQVNDALANGTFVHYPLNGYQYASIHTASEEDPDSRYVSGAANCPEAQAAALTYWTTDQASEAKTANADLYKKLNLGSFEGTLPEAYLNYNSALEIADYISYQYMHNSSIYETFSANDSEYTGVYEKLRYLADEAAWNLYGNTSDSSTDGDDQAIGGKTLAASILNSLGKRANSSRDEYGTAYPLTFYVGEEDAMMSLMSLMRLDTKSSRFQSIPPYSSAMMFELYSVGGAHDSELPSDPRNLWVRFLFHNGTDYDSEAAIAYPIFRNGPSKWETPWTEFQQLFSGIAMGGTADWCAACSSRALFCSGVDTPVVPSAAAQENKTNVSPVVGGVIGAVVSLAVAALVFALAMRFAGLRFHRVDRTHACSKKRASDVGGFKRAAKLPSDPDVNVPKNSVGPTVGIFSMPHGNKGHERVDSWELRHKESLDAIDSVAGKRVEPHDCV